MVRVVRRFKSGTHTKSDFRPDKDGVLHYPDGARVTSDDFRLMEDLFVLGPKKLRDKFESMVEVDAGNITEPALVELRDNPKAWKPFLRLLKDSFSPGRVRLSFRQFVGDALMLPDAVFSALTPPMLNALENYPWEVSEDGVKVLRGRPDALKTFLRFKRLMNFRPRHRFSEMMEDAIGLPEGLFGEMAPQILKRLQKYSDEIPDRTRDVLLKRPEQLRSYLLLRQELGLSGRLPALPELAGKILKGVDDSSFAEQADAVITLLSGCPKKQLGDNTLRFLGRYQPDQLRRYLQTQAHERG